MLVNGKRKWPDDLRYRYDELANSDVNTSDNSAEENWWPVRDSTPLPPLSGSIS